MLMASYAVVTCSKTLAEGRGAGGGGENLCRTIERDCSTKSWGSGSPICSTFGGFGETMEADVLV